jgi:hypothetical protein
MFLLKYVGFSSFYTQCASTRAKQVAQGTFFWFFSCSKHQKGNPAKRKREICTFSARRSAIVVVMFSFQPLHSPPLASPAPPVCEPYTPLPAGGARRFEAHIQQTCRLEFASHQSGRTPSWPHAPHLGSKRPSRIPIQNTHPATNASSTQQSTATCERFTITSESIRDIVPEKALDIVVPQRRGRRRLTVGAWQCIGAGSV